MRSRPPGARASRSGYWRCFASKANSPLIHPRELDQATVRSLVAESIAANNADRLAALAERLESLRKTHPDDLSVAITIALEALATGDSHRIEPALSRLVELVEKTPLEALPAGARANSRQRTEAARLIPLWLVARACGKETSPTIKETASQLAARALEAAGRQREPQWVLAILREQGQLALDHHDRSAALAAWSRMLNMVVTPEVAKAPRPRVTRPGAAPARAQPASTTAPSGAEKPQKNKVSDASTSLWHGLPARVRVIAHEHDARATGTRLGRAKWPNTILGGRASRRATAQSSSDGASPSPNHAGPVSLIRRAS